METLILTGWGWSDYACAAALTLRHFGKADIRGVSTRRLPELLNEISGYKTILILGVGLTGDPELIPGKDNSMSYIYTASRLRLLWWKICTYLYSLSGNTYLKEHYRMQLQLRKQYDTESASRDTGGKLP